MANKLYPFETHKETDHLTQEMELDNVFQVFYKSEGGDGLHVGSWDVIVVFSVFTISWNLNEGILSLS